MEQLADFVPDQMSWQGFYAASYMIDNSPHQVEEAMSECLNLEDGAERLPCLVMSHGGTTHAYPTGSDYSNRGFGLTRCAVSDQYSEWLPNVEESDYGMSVYSPTSRAHARSDSDG